MTNRRHSCLSGTSKGLGNLCQKLGQTPSIFLMVPPAEGHEKGLGTGEASLREFLWGDWWYGALCGCEIPQHMQFHADPFLY